MHFTTHIDAGQLRKLNTDLPFEFNVSSQSKDNQARYEALGEVLTKQVYQMLLDAGLHKIELPSSSSSSSSQSNFVFATKSDLKNTKKLMVLIHGSGPVRAGQWSRRLIANESIDHGTQLPYIKKAMDMGYDVLVTNANCQTNQSPQEHIDLVWAHLIEPSMASIQSFAVIAHSYGGVLAINMAKSYLDAFVQKCSALVFIDSNLPTGN